MELSDYIRMLRKGWLLGLVLLLAGVGIAAAFSLARTPLYESHSKVFVSSQSTNSIAELQQGSTFTEARVSTYVNLVETPIVMNPVISELGLEMTSTELAEMTSATNPLNTTLIEITVVDADPVLAAEIANALGASLTAVVENIETPTDSETSPVRLTRVEDATPESAPVSPNVPLNLAIGGFLGLALGVAIVTLRSVLDNKIRTVRDLDRVTDRPAIGVIPFDSRADSRPIIVHQDPHNPRSEAYRVLRTNLQFLEMDGGHTFVVSSSLPSEGKSTTTVNLAIALADAGKRVALIDTDLRKPKVAQYLGIEGASGLTDVLIGRASPADVMLPWGGRPLYVLAAGRTPPNPSELLGSSQMVQLLEGFARDFDVVLLDTPPLLPVTDAAILARMSTAVIMAVAAGKTTTQQLSSALGNIDTVGAKLGGFVLTMAPTRGADSYGYGYGYGDKLVD